MSASAQSIQADALKTPKFKFIDNRAFCKFCKHVLQSPVTLMCCNVNICKKHIDELRIKNSNNAFRCSFCKKLEQNPNSFRSNQALEKQIKKQLGVFS